ncbi:unnamed protein product [Prorocentrum cordatum]|uniref:Uncharacterized protein n=1 Tax=Prorocentrum cordatum TaxID=2364126 RepID=A0ABN9XI75_9DINO|nr:unnamed protein product [Polarella glacialis]
MSSDRPVHGRHPGHPVPEPSGQHHASPVSKKKAEEMRLNDRHYAKLCVNPAQHHSSSDNVTRFDGPPRVLWQTEKQIEKELPDVVNSMRKKWVDLNKDIEMKYMDDGEALAFVEANFDKSVLDAFKGFPLGVMRADFWRYLVVYTYGGVYADVDDGTPVAPNGDRGILTITYGTGKLSGEYMRDEVCLGGPSPLPGLCTPVDFLAATQEPSARAGRRAAAAGAPAGAPTAAMSGSKGAGGAGSKQATDLLDAAFGSDDGEASKRVPPEQAAAPAPAPRLAMPSWAAKLGEKAKKLGDGAKEAIANEVRLMAEDVGELKTGMQEGAKETAKDAKALQEKLAREAAELKRAAAEKARLLKAKAEGEPSEAAAASQEGSVDASGATQAGPTAADEAAKAAEKVRKTANDWWRKTSSGLSKGWQQASEAAAGLAGQPADAAQAPADAGDAPSGPAPFSPPARGAAAAPPEAAPTAAPAAPAAASADLLGAPAPPQAAPRSAAAPAAPAAASVDLLGATTPPSAAPAAASAELLGAAAPPSATAAAPAPSPPPPAAAAAPPKATAASAQPKSALESIEAELDDIFDSLGEPEPAAAAAPAAAPEAAPAAAAKGAAGQKPAASAAPPPKVTESSFDDLWDSIMDEDDK